MPPSGCEDSDAVIAARRAACKMTTRPKRTIFLEHVPPKSSLSVLSSPHANVNRSGMLAAEDNAKTQKPRIMLDQIALVCGDRETLKGRNDRGSKKPKVEGYFSRTPCPQTVPADFLPRRNHSPMVLKQHSTASYIAKKSKVTSLRPATEVVRNGHASDDDGEHGGDYFPKIYSKITKVSNNSLSRLGPKIDPWHADVEVVSCASLAEACHHSNILKQCVENSDALRAKIMPPTENRRSASPVSAVAICDAREEQHSRQQNHRQFNGFVVPHAPANAPPKPAKHLNKKVPFDMMRTYQNIEPFVRNYAVDKTSSTFRNHKAPPIRSGPAAVVAVKEANPMSYFLRPAFVEALLASKPKNGTTVHKREKCIVIDQDIFGASDLVCAPGKRRADACGGVTTNIKQSYFYQCFFCNFQQQSGILNKKLKLRRAGSFSTSDDDILRDTAAQIAPNDADFESFLAHLRHEHSSIAPSGKRGSKAETVFLQFDCNFSERRLQCRLATKKSAQFTSNGQQQSVTVMNTKKVDKRLPKVVNHVKFDSDEEAHAARSSESDIEIEELEVKPRLAVASRPVTSAKPSTTAASSLKAGTKTVSLQHPNIGKFTFSPIVCFSASSKQTREKAVDARKIRFTNRQSSKEHQAKEETKKKEASPPPTPVPQQRILHADEKYMGVGPILSVIDTDHGPEKCPIDCCNIDDYNSRRRCETTLLDFYHHLVAHHVPAATTDAEEMRCKWHDCIDNLTSADEEGGDEDGIGRRTLRNSNSVDRLRQHYLLHLGPRPFRCALKGCNKRFDDANRFANHMNLCEKNPWRKNVAEQQQQDLAAARTVSGAELKLKDDVFLIPASSSTAEQQQRNELLSSRPLIRTNSFTMRRTYNSSAHLFAAAARGSSSNLAALAAGDGAGCNATKTTTSSLLAPADLHVDTLMKSDECLKNPHAMLPAWRVHGFEQLGVNEFPASFYVQFWHVNRERRIEVSMPVQYGVLDKHRITMHRFRVQFFRSLQHLILQQWLTYFSSHTNDGYLLSNVLHNCASMQNGTKKRRADDSINSSPSSAAASVGTPAKRLRREPPSSMEMKSSIAVASSIPATCEASSLPNLQREAVICSLMFDSTTLSWPYFKCQRKKTTHVEAVCKTRLHSTQIDYEPAVLLPETVFAANSINRDEKQEAVDADMPHSSGSGSQIVRQHMPQVFMSPPDSSSNTTYHSACSFAEDAADDVYGNTTNGGRLLNGSYAEQQSTSANDDSMLFKLPTARREQQRTMPVKIEAFDDVACTTNTTQMYNSIFNDLSSAPDDVRVRATGNANDDAELAVASASSFSTGRTDSADDSLRISNCSVKTVAVSVDASLDGRLLQDNMHPQMRALVLAAYRMAANSLPPAFLSVQSLSTA